MTSNVGNPDLIFIEATATAEKWVTKNVINGTMETRIAAALWDDSVHLKEVEEKFDIENS